MGHGHMWYIPSFSSVASSATILAAHTNTSTPTRRADADTLLLVAFTLGRTLARPATAT